MSTPVIYVPPGIYTSKTPAFFPPFVRFLRTGSIAMLDWVSLRFIDHAPPIVWVLTGVFAVAILAVIESKDWLRFKGKSYFGRSLFGFLFGSGS